MADSEETELRRFRRSVLAGGLAISTLALGLSVFAPKFVREGSGYLFPAIFFLFALALLSAGARWLLVRNASKFILGRRLLRAWLAPRVSCLIAALLLLPMLVLAAVLRLNWGAVLTALVAVVAISVVFSLAGGTALNIAILLRHFRGSRQQSGH